MVYLSFIYDIREKTKNRDFWYHFVLISLILIAGLRWRLGVDTPNYIFRFYHEYPVFSKFSFKNYPIGEDPFYVLINSIVKSLGCKFFVVQLIQSSIVNILIFKYIKKHSRYIFTCVLFYFVCYCYTEYNMEIMRGGISVVIYLYANDYFLLKKWLKGYSLLFLALMFHAQTIALFLLPLIYFLRLNKIGVLFMMGSFIIGIILDIMLTDYLSLLALSDDTISQKLESYAESDYLGTQRYNLKYMIAIFFPWVIYSLGALLYIKKYDKECHLLKFEPFIILGVMMILIQTNFQIAYRFVDYFRIYFILFFVELIIRLLKNNTILSNGVNCFRVFVLFVPLFFMIGFTNYIRREEYFPYCSVFDRKINKDRELNYHGRLVPRPDAKINEY